MSVGQHCQRDPVRAQRDDTVREVAKQMELQSAGCVVVVDDKERPVGVLTDRDIVVRVLRRGLDPDDTRADVAMSDEPSCVRETTPLTTALRRMRSDAVRRLPVVGEEGKLVGLFHWNHAIAIVADELEQAARVAAATNQA